MQDPSLADDIRGLIDLGTEGDYWDFKNQWHENNADLLHDIICMANNLADRDAYIIIGVSDSKGPDGVQIKGVPSEHRKSQQNLIDFLKDKKFGGGIRPVIYVQTISLDCQDIDVIIIKNTINTPYFLRHENMPAYLPSICNKNLKAQHYYKALSPIQSTLY